MLIYVNESCVLKKRQNDEPWDMAWGTMCQPQTCSSPGLTGKPLPTVRQLHQTSDHLISYHAYNSYSSATLMVMIWLPLETSNLSFKSVHLTGYKISPLRCLTGTFKFGMSKSGLLPANNSLSRVLCFSKWHCHPSMQTRNLRSSHLTKSPHLIEYQLL